MGKIMSYSFKKADDPFFRTSFRVFSSNRFSKENPETNPNSKVTSSIGQRCVSSKKRLTDKQM
jgi:hypothetical protein